MDKIEQYRDIIENILTKYEEIEISGGNIRLQAVCDRVRDRYLVVVVGRENMKRVHGCFIHVGLINGKFWIHHDNTDEGVATFLLEHGVPNNHIVLAFRAPEMRQYTEFAVA